MKGKVLFYVLAITLAANIGTSALAAEFDEESLKAAVAVENALAAVVDHAKSSVVVITNKQVQRVSTQPFMLDEFPDFFNFFPRGRQQMPRQQEERWTKSFGSGVIVDKKGYVVTNHHVIQDFKYLEVKLEDGTVYDMEKDKDSVKVVGIDKESDLAVLQIGGGKKKDYKALAFADSDKLRVGQWAIAIGAPFELEHSVTVGHVSQTGRHDMGLVRFDNYVQTDASINPGNSGGPLLNIRGEIIGINQFIVTGGQSRGSIGLGFSIASNLAKQVVDALIEHGEVPRPYLGVMLQALTDDLKEQFGAEYGVIVSEVKDGDAAAAAGLKAGDIIQRVGKTMVKTPRELSLAVTQYKPGDTIELGLIRGRKEKTLSVKAGKWKTDAMEGTVDSDVSEALDLKKLGVTLQEDNGVVRIQEINPEGAVARVNKKSERKIVEGDVIVEANWQPIRRVKDMEAAMKDSKNGTVLLQIEHAMNGGRTCYRYYVAIPLKEKK